MDVASAFHVGGAEKRNDNVKSGELGCRDVCKLRGYAVGRLSAFTHCFHLLKRLKKKKWREIKRSAGAR